MCMCVCEASYLIPVLFTIFSEKYKNPAVNNIFGEWLSHSHETDQQENLCEIRGQLIGELHQKYPLYSTIVSSREARNGQKDCLKRKKLRNSTKVCEGGAIGKSCHSITCPPGTPFHKNIFYICHILHLLSNFWCLISTPL